MMEKSIKLTITTDRFFMGSSSFFFVSALVADLFLFPLTASIHRHETARTFAHSCADCNARRMNSTETLGEHGAP